jgi:Ser/Thr protein kinase RdoA (MazF antagonist)
VFATGLLDPHAEGLARILEVYRWEPNARVSSHNDPNPQNVLFDGERLWLVDWETAYRNDPLVDVAVLAQNLAPTPETEDALLAAWLGHAPDRVLRARLILMRALVRFYYAGLVLGLAAAAPRAAPDTDLTPLTQAELGAAVAQGRLKLGTPEAMHALGKMFLAAFLAAVHEPGLEEALRVARTG